MTMMIVKNLVPLLLRDGQNMGLLRVFQSHNQVLTQNVDPSVTFSMYSRLNAYCTTFEYTSE